jgi:hypothetical protein
MTAGEDQPQPVVGKGEVVVLGLGLVDRRLELRQSREDPPLVLEVALTAEPVDRAVARDPGDPGARVGRRPVPGPALERDRERVLDRVLGGVEVPEDADQRGDRPPRLAPEQAVDLAGVLGYETAPSLACSLEPPTRS